MKDVGSIKDGARDKNSEKILSVVTSSRQQSSSCVADFDLCQMSESCVATSNWLDHVVVQMKALKSVWMISSSRLQQLLSRYPTWLTICISSLELHILIRFLSASLYVSKRGAYWDRLCRDVDGRWSLVVTRVHCGQTVHPRPIVTMEH